MGNIGKRWKIDGKIEMSHDFTIKNVGFSMRFCWKNHGDVFFMGYVCVCLVILQQPLKIEKS